eukprot:jgi/Mesvir1/18204/Mv25049-RA.1
MDIVHFKKETDIKLGQLVWAKVPSHPWWPGIVFDPKKATQAALKLRIAGHVLVAFFGDGTFNWFRPRDVVPYAPNLAVLREQKSKNKDFPVALREIQEAAEKIAAGKNILEDDDDEDDEGEEEEDEEEEDDSGATPKSMRGRIPTILGNPDDVTDVDPAALLRVLRLLALGQLANPASILAKSPILLQFLRFRRAAFGEKGWVPGSTARASRAAESPGKSKPGVAIGTKRKAPEGGEKDGQGVPKSKGGDGGATVQKEPKKAKPSKPSGQAGAGVPVGEAGGSSDARGPDDGGAVVEQKKKATSTDVTGTPPVKTKEGAGVRTQGAKSGEASGGGDKKKNLQRSDVDVMAFAMDIVNRRGRPFKVISEAKRAAAAAGAPDGGVSAALAAAMVIANSAIATAERRPGPYDMDDLWSIVAVAASQELHKQQEQGEGGQAVGGSADTSIKKTSTLTPKAAEAAASPVDKPVRRKEPPSAPSGKSPSAPEPVAKLQPRISDEQLAKLRSSPGEASFAAAQVRPAWQQPR